MANSCEELSLAMENGEVICKDMIVHRGDTAYVVPVTTFSRMGIEYSDDNYLYLPESTDLTNNEEICRELELVSDKELAKYKNE
jgi:hypothetical protein